MKVSITQKEQRAGLLKGRKEWETQLHISPSEEERSIVSACCIGEMQIVDLPSISGDRDVNYTAEQLMSQKIISVSPSKWAANQVAKKMRGAAVALKSLIEETMEDQTEEFEL